MKRFYPRGGSKSPHYARTRSADQTDTISKITKSKYNQTSSVGDGEFLRRFEARELHSFRHVDHVRMAYAYSRRGGAAAAVQGALRIRAFAEAAGNPGKFHLTITVAWARVVAHLVERSEEEDFESFLAAHPRLLDRQLLGAHYSGGLLFSAEARSRFVEPDLLALP